MENTEQPSAPACYKCDDLGYTAGNEVFGVARCDCPIGAKADMRALTGDPKYGGARVVPASKAYEALADADKQLRRAERALLRAGFQDNGGEDWKPPLGPAPHFITVREESLSEITADLKRAPYTIMQNKHLLERAYDLIDEARNAGQVLTIELVPLDQGGEEMVADLRPKQERAPSLSIIDMIRENIAVPEGKAIVTSAASEPIVFDLWIGPQDDATRAMVGKALDEQDKAHVPLIAPPQSGTEIEARCNAMPLKTMMHPERRTEARKVIWPDPSKMNFTTERRDPFSTLTQEQHNKRSTDKKRRDER